MACFPGAIFLSNRARTLSSKQVCYHVGRPEKPGRTNPAPSRSQVEVDTVNESVARIEAIIGRKVETRQKGQLFPMTQGTPVNVCRNRWLILIFNISRRRISVLRDVCEESTFCCVSASARQLHRYC